MKVLEERYDVGDCGKRDPERCPPISPRNSKSSKQSGGGPSRREHDRSDTHKENQHKNTVGEDSGKGGSEEWESDVSEEELSEAEDKYVEFVRDHVHEISTDGNVMNIIISTFTRLQHEFVSMTKAVLGTYPETFKKYRLPKVGDFVAVSVKVDHVRQTVYGRVQGVEKTPNGRTHVFEVCIPVGVMSNPTLHQWTVLKVLEDNITFIEPRVGDTVKFTEDGDQEWKISSSSPESCTQTIFAVVTRSNISVVKSMKSMTIIQRQATIDVGGFDNPTWQGIRAQNDGFDIPVLDMFPGL